jgi:hypothetical protein
MTNRLTRRFRMLAAVPSPMMADAASRRLKIY